MKKKLLAVAVVGAFALPGAALAQSSVTISGVMKGSFESLSLGNYQRALGNSSQTAVMDDSSAIVFSVREDLGGGLAAIGRFDMRFTLDAGTIAGNGNNHIGLQSKNWGRIFIGRQDLHYFNTESNIATKGSLRSNPVSLLAYAGAYGAAGAAINGGQAVANATRTPNVIHYTTPNWNGVTVIAAYSSSTSATEVDIASGQRKGSAFNLHPNWQGKNFQLGYSYFRSKPDVAPAAAAAVQTAAGAAAATGNDQRGDRLYGSYQWGGFKVGLAWDKSKLTSYAAANSGTVVSRRTVWSLPMSYSWGNHEVHGHYTKAGHDKAAAAAGLQTGANMFALGYSYSLSKRTSAALTYARINNDANAGYIFFTSGAFGASNTSGLIAGEDPRLWSVTLRHTF